MKTFEGKLVSKSIKVGIVAARFNEFITSKLLNGALDGLLRHEVREDDVHVAWVPGAFEIPLVASKMAKSGRYDAVICLGAVIRGSTSHYDYVCNEVSKGIAAVSLESGVPVLFGVLTTENIEQAIERAGTKAGNKGYDCAVSAIEMVNLLHELDAAERVSLSSRHTLTFPELTIDGRSQQAFQNGTALALTRIEFNMLLFLASNPGVTLSKEDLFSAVWGRDSADTLKVVANTVSNLRRKLGGSQTYIRTVRGGYVFSAVSATA